MNHFWHRNKKKQSVLHCQCTKELFFWITKEFESVICGIKIKGPQFTMLKEKYTLKTIPKENHSMINFFYHRVMEL